MKKILAFASIIAIAFYSCKKDPKINITNKGTGLGLSLSYDVIRAHGGELTVESVEGQSTTFMIDLPGTS